MPRVGFAACGHSRGISGWLWFSCGVVRCGDGVVVVFVFLGIFGCVRFGVGGGGREVGCGSIILCGLDTFLIFPDFLRLVVQQLVRKLVCTSNNNNNNRASFHLW